MEKRRAEMVAQHQHPTRNKEANHENCDARPCHSSIFALKSFYHDAISSIV